jgi:hypothetical protein
MLEENEGWRITNYHAHVQSSLDFEFENDKWYEIGFKNQFGGNFVHQGIRKYENGLFDDNGYRLKPFPTHAREIVLTKPVGVIVYEK